MSIFKEPFFLLCPLYRVYFNRAKRGKRGQRRKSAGSPADCRHAEESPDEIRRQTAAQTAQTRRSPIHRRNPDHLHRRPAGAREDAGYPQTDADTERVRDNRCQNVLENFSE